MQAIITRLHHIRGQLKTFLVVDMWDSVKSRWNTSSAEGQSVVLPQSHMMESQQVHGKPSNRTVGLSCPFNKIINIQQEGVESCIAKAVDALSLSQAIALPTDTVYGVAVHAQNTEAVNKLYSLKDRWKEKPVAICVSDVDDISIWAKVSIPKELLEELVPGAVTLVFERSDRLNPNLNPKTSLVGVRIPDNTFTRLVCKGSGQPLALTSANLSGSSSSLAVEEFRDVWPQLALIFDNGHLGHDCRLGSTVIDLSNENYFSIIRRGSAYVETIRKLLCYGLQELPNRR